MAREPRPCATLESLNRARVARFCSRHCDGCDSEQPDVRDYLVTHHDGTTSDAAYCGDCAALARVDWNGETQSIEAKS
jgi:hypothetical protein